MVRGQRQHQHHQWLCQNNLQQQWRLGVAVCVLVVACLAQGQGPTTAPPPSFTQPTWEDMLTNMLAPVGRALHSAVSQGEEMYMYGGWDESSAFGQVWQFQSKYGIWSKAGSPWLCRLGHIAELINNQMYVFGGYMPRTPPFSGDVCDISLLPVLVPAGHFDRFDITTHEWSTVNATGTVPSPRAVHAAATVGSCLIIHGGLGDGDNLTCPFVALGDTFVFDTETSAWEQLPQTGAHPGVRYAHNMVAYENNAFLAFGCEEPGLPLGLQGETLCDPFAFCARFATGIWMLDLSSGCTADAIGSWALLQESTLQIMSAADSIAYAQFGFGWLLFGGVMSDSTLNKNVISLNSDLAWTTQEIFWLSQTPPPTAYGTMTPISVNESKATYALQVYGGTDGPTFGEYAWQFVPEMQSWFLVSVRAYSELNMGSQCILNGTNYVFGGFDTNFVVVKGLFSLITQSNGLSTVQLLTLTKCPEPRFGHTMTAIDAHRALMFGGADNSLACLNELYLFDSMGEAWEKIAFTTGPAARWGHYAVSPSEGTLIVAGGALASYSALLRALANIKSQSDSQYWFFDSATRLWTGASCTSFQGINPCQVLGATAAISGDYMVVFGGINLQTLTFQTVSNTFLLHLPSRTWSLSTATSSPRAFHSMTSLSPQKVVMHGGKNSFSGWQELFQKPWLSDTVVGEFVQNEWTWQEWEPAANSIGVAFHVAFSTDPTSLWVYGGSWEQQNQTMSLLPVSQYFAPFQCQKGTYSASWASEPCLPCPIGTYAFNEASTQCHPCPTGTTTKGTGTMYPPMCSVCSDANYCGPHGTCVVEEAAEAPSCKCFSGYAGKTCDIDVYALVGAGVAGFFIVCILAVLIVMRLRKHIRQYKSDAQVHEQLLAEQELEIREMERVWNIDAKNVQLIRRIDAGGLGEVHLALLAGMDGFVAVKRLRAELAELSDQRSFSELEREIRFLRTIRAPNIVMFYGFGVDNGVPFLVTEYMPHGSLMNILATPRYFLSSVRRLRLARDIATGMEYLHSLNRMHRDLKSPNVLVSNSWTAKVADFGTSRLVREMSHRTETVNVGQQLLPTGNHVQIFTQHTGTLMWTAPEVLKGNAYDLSVDVYSYGVVLYEIETRKLPWHDKGWSSWTLRDKIMEGERPDVDDSWPTELAHLVQTCWNQDPEVRPTFSRVLELLQFITFSSDPGTEEQQQQQ